MCQEISTDAIIRNHDTVIYDLGAQYEGYNAEFARTRFVGGPTAKQGDFYKLVYESEQEASKAIRPGARCTDVVQISRKVLRERSFGDYEFNYNLGHGLGVAVWEYPIVDKRSQAVFEPNIVVAIEPAVYKPGFGGVRIEDLVQVTDTGSKIKQD